MDPEAPAPPVGFETAPVPVAVARVVAPVPVATRVELPVPEGLEDAVAVVGTSVANITLAYTHFFFLIGIARVEYDGVGLRWRDCG